MKLEGFLYTTQCLWPVGHDDRLVNPHRFNPSLTLPPMLCMPLWNLLALVLNVRSLRDVLGCPKSMCRTATPPASTPDSRGRAAPCCSPTGIRSTLYSFFSIARRRRHLARGLTLAHPRAGGISLRLRREERLLDTAVDNDRPASVWLTGNDRMFLPLNVSTTILYAVLNAGRSILDT